MKLHALPGQPHLSYCTNIHAGEGLREMRASLRSFIPAIRKYLQERDLLSPDAQFGLGLRLAAQAAAELRSGQELQTFTEELAALQAYVFTINAFPWGNFHQKPVKEAVYQPDWTSRERLDYTNNCAHILADLLPPGEVGSISTVPLGYRDTRPEEQRFNDALPQLRACVANLKKIEQEYGKRIVLALEPEPGCLLENSKDALRFFEQYWFAPANLMQLATLCDCDQQQALLFARRHLGLCYDVCHGAVEFEDPVISLQGLREAGIYIAKIQLSCALKIDAMSPALIPALRSFDDGIYLHQVVRNDGVALLRSPDLPQALESDARHWSRQEWRIHCHVPLFWRAGGALDSTWNSLQQVLRYVGQDAVCPHLEVETYTWDVLPAQLRTLDKASAIACELQTVIEEIKA